MTDFDTIWRTQDEIRTVVNAVLGECIWNLSYNERRMAIELELTEYLKEEDADAFICQFPVPADYDGAGSKGTNLSPRLPLSNFDGAEMFDLMCREHDEFSERFNSLVMEYRKAMS